MKTQHRAADLGITVGELPKGPRNKITDVPGVKVGHATICLLYTSPSPRDS